MSDFKKDLPQYSQALKTRGWVIIPGVFSAEEVEKMRKNALQAEKNGQLDHDIFSIPHTASLITDDRILTIVRAMHGGEPVYFGDSVIQVAREKMEISHGLHKDNVDRYDQQGPDWKGDFSLLRLGIYLQDHAYFSEGLIVRSDSHKVADRTSGEKVMVPSKAGDVVVWYLSTTHSGSAKRLKFAPNLCLAQDGSSQLQKMLYYRLPSFMWRPKEKDRITYFATFGRDDEHLDRYLRYLKNRQYAVSRWKKSPYPAEIMALAAGKDLKVLDMESEVRGLDLEQVNKGHYALAY